MTTDSRRPRPCDPVRSDVTREDHFQRFSDDQRMSVDLSLGIASFVIGIVVGLTGMGGGALMTPVLVLFFDVLPLTAVSSDLVASAVMKPVGSLVHLRRGTVHRRPREVAVPSDPSLRLSCGVLIARWLGGGDDVQGVIRTALGDRAAPVRSGLDGPGVHPACGACAPEGRSRRRRCLSSRPAGGRATAFRWC